MAKRIASVGGVALRAGVSRNGRLYTADVIERAVSRAQKRIKESGGIDFTDISPDPLSQRTHHAAEDDSTRIVGRVTDLYLAEPGVARFKADIADTDAGRTIAALLKPRDPNDPDSVDPFLKGVSIRGAWIGPERRENHGGQLVKTGDDLEIDGLDWTARPGVVGAGVDEYEEAKQDAPRETAAGRVLIYESVEAHVTDVVEEAAAVEPSTPVTENTPVEEKGAPALKSGKPAAPQTKATTYADPGYQDDKAKRYALDTKDQAKAAWSYINMPKNAKKYTPNQLKRVKQRIIKALQKFGVKVDTKEHWVIDSGEVTESAVTEWYGDEARGSFRVELNNGPVCVTVSSYCIDPADLDVIGRAAMAAACDSLKSLDPDMDGDIDVDGAPSEDTDNDMETAPEAGTTETVAEEAAEPENAAPEPAADQQNEEDLVADETTNQAVEPSADTAKAEAPAAVTLSGEQFAQLLAALRPAAAPEPALAGAATETAPAAKTAENAEKTETTESASGAEVTESEEDRIARLVAEGVAKALPNAIQEAVEKGGVAPQRKGLVAQPAAVTESASGEDASYATLPGWPVHAQTGIAKKPHELTNDEFEQHAGSLMLAYVDSMRGQRA